MEAIRLRPIREVHPLRHLLSIGDTSLPLIQGVHHPPYSLLRDSLRLVLHHPADTPDRPHLAVMVEMRFLLPRHQRPLVDVLLPQASRVFRACAPEVMPASPLTVRRIYGDLDIMFANGVSARKFKTTPVAKFENTDAKGVEVVLEKAETKAEVGHFGIKE